MQREPGESEGVFPPQAADSTAPVWGPSLVVSCLRSLFPLVTPRGTELVTAAHLSDLPGPCPHTEQATHTVFSVSLHRVTPAGPLADMVIATLFLT